MVNVSLKDSDSTEPREGHDAGWASMASAGAAGTGETLSLVPCLLMLVSVKIGLSTDATIRAARIKKP